MHNNTIQLKFAKFEPSIKQINVIKTNSYN